MSDSHSSHSTVKNPGSLKNTGGIFGFFFVLVLVGAAALGVGAMTDSKRAWMNFLINHFYFLSLAIGGLFFVAIQHLTGAMWSAPVRRLAEAMTGYFPILILTTIALFYGMHSLYEWTHPEFVKGDLVLEGKVGYLNTTFFMIRNCVAIGLWMLFAFLIVGNSVKQDESKAYSFTLKNKTLSPIFLMIFAVSFTMVSFDQLMSLDPHWFSTMFGVYCFAGSFYSTLAFVCLCAIFLRKRGELLGIVTDDTLHDLGKFMFGFSVFWAYIAFSQYMLIWYANLPEETGYFIRRMTNPWLCLTIIVFVAKFLVPFFVLLPRESKRSTKVLTFVAIWMLCAHFVDISWMVQPEFFVGEGPRFGWMEIGSFIGFFGLFGLAVTRFLSKRNVVAIGDPRLNEAVFHHHQ